MNRLTNGCPYLFESLGLALAYALLAKLAVAFYSVNGFVSIIWPCSGLALTALLIGGSRYWPGIFMGALAGNLMTGNSLGISALIASGNALEALAGFWLLCNNRHFDLALKHPQDYVWLGVSAMLSALVGALIGIAGLALSGLQAPQALFADLLNWWQGDVLGIMLITPFILVWRHPPHGWFSWGRLPETIACFGLAWFFGQIIFLGWFSQLLIPMMGFWMILFFVWSAVRFGHHGALLVMFISTTQNLLGLVRQAVFWGATDFPTGMVNFWLYSLVLSGVGVLLASILYESNQAKQTLSLSEEKLRKMFEMSPVGMARNSLDGHYLEANDTFLAMVGYTLAELNQLTYWHLTPQEYEAQEAFQLDLLRTHRRYGPYEKEYIHKDGHRFAVRLNGVLITGSDGEQFIWSMVEDITERKQNEEAMRLATLVYQNSSEAMMVTDAHDTIIAINPAFTYLTGYTQADIIGQTPHIRSRGHQDKACYQQMWRQVHATGAWQGELWNLRKSGEARAEWLNINTIFNQDGSVHRRVALFHDITEKKAADDLIWQQANFDSLTGLPNRHLFHKRLTEEVEKMHGRQRQLALLSLDLDRFKEVNDSLG
ncbi:MAG: PAS domain S-box protein, partial [Methylovulum sp.]|nr:PAS domain S-box protein [Methylovulum sp.]